MEHNKVPIKFDKAQVLMEIVWVFYGENLALNNDSLSQTELIF